jgi:hypothetical protein
MGTLGFMKNWTKLLFAELCAQDGNSFAYTPRVKRLMLIALLAGATLSAGAMSLFLLGCCALPFHRYVHRIMPLCGGIVRAMSHNGAEETTPPATPTRRPTIANAVAPHAPASPDLRVSRHVPASPPASLRNIVSLGALRCDDDVGLHLLLTMLLI